MAIDGAFNETVEYYDGWIRKAVPGVSGAQIAHFPKVAPSRR